VYFSDEVKAHRRETANEGADILADKAVSDPKVGKKWCQQTNRAVLTWDTPCREAGKVICHQDRHSTFNTIVRMQYENGQQRMRCKNMKRGLQVLGDKKAHSGDDMKNGVKMMT